MMLVATNCVSPCIKVAVLGRTRVPTQGAGPTTVLIVPDGQAASELAVINEVAIAMSVHGSASTSVDCSAYRSRGRRSGR